MKHERRKIALAQMANAGSVEANLQKSLALLREAAENGADGAVLGVQKMVHVAQTPQFCEQDYYTPRTSWHRGLLRPPLPESIRTERCSGYRRFGTAQAVTAPLIRLKTTLTVFP